MCDAPSQSPPALAPSPAPLQGQDHPEVSGPREAFRTAGGCRGAGHAWVQPAEEGAADLPSSLCPRRPA